MSPKFLTFLHTCFPIFISCYSLYYKFFHEKEIGIFFYQKSCFLSVHRAQLLKGSCTLVQKRKHCSCNILEDFVQPHGSHEKGKQEELPVSCPIFCRKEVEILLDSKGT